MLLATYKRFDTLPDKTEKKYRLKAHIYVDALITFYRLPPHIEESPEELGKKLKIPTIVVDHLLNEFT
jgi:hypothetical protein